MENPFISIERQIQRVESILMEIKSMHLQSNSGNSVPELMTIQQASEYTNYAVQTLYCKVSKREVPFIKRGNKLWFNKQALTEWLNLGTRKVISDEIDSMITNSLKRKRRA